MIHVNQENAQFVRSFVQKEMETHGLILSSSPDLYVDLFVSLKLQEQVNRGISVASYAPRSLAYYQVGTLTVQLMESKENEVLWEGSKTIALWKMKEKKIRKRADYIVSRIFRKFDPNTLRN